MNNLRSAFDTCEKSFVEFDKSVLQTDMNTKIDDDIREKMKENISDRNTLNRTFHGMSALHDKDFYKKSFGSKYCNKEEKTQEKVIEKFEINNINYDNFNMKEFKKAYISQGIHIYDVNIQGNYGNGNQKGVVTFKVRKNEEISGFNEKLQEINKTIGKEMKAEFHTKKETNRRPMYILSLI